MSLHARLSPEALERLRAQKRNNSIGSIIIGLLVVVILAMVTALFMIPLPEEDDGDVFYVVPYEKPDKPHTPVEVREMVEKKPRAPSQTPTRVIISTQPASLQAMVTDFEVPEPSLEMGVGIDFGDSNGFTPGGPNIPGFPPNDPMGRRCSQQLRMERLKEAGGVVAGEEAVVKALDWLQETQNENGSWGDQYQSAMTGFAILAYLGHCETPESRKYGETVSKGLAYLIDLGMRNEGKLTVSPLNGHQWVYEHAIATYALAEAQTFSKMSRKPFPGLKNATKDAGEIIMDGQADSGGWNYKYSNSPTQGDNSVGFWQIQALKACKHTGIWKDAKFKQPVRKAIDFLEKVQGPNGAIGYRLDPNRSPHLTGGAVLCMQIWGEGDSRAAKDGIDWVRKNSKFQWGQSSANLYYHYYNAQAMINAGGDEWDWYNAMIRDQLIEAQNEDGSWTQKMNHGPINQHMATCLATLTLEVYYRFLPGTNK